MTAYEIKVAIAQKLEEGYQKADGQYWHWHKKDGQHMRFNLALAVENQHDYLNRTVLHELAHYITRMVYGTKVQGVQPHGREWKFVMSRVMGQNPSRCHKFDVSNVRQTRKRTARKHRYICPCMEHFLTDIRHRRALNGAVYRCTKCGTNLKWSLAKEYG